MGPISEHNLTLFLIQFGLLLGICKLAGYFFEKIKQSSVTAELLVGLILGPSIFGRIAPGIQATLFPDQAVQRSMLETIAWVGSFFLLMETGLEVNFARIWKQKTQAIKISFSDLIIPVLISFIPMYLLPERYLGATDQRLLFALFMSVVMTISAMPETIRGLKDLNILKTDVGFLIISALTINDIVGWVVFTIILGMFAHGSFELAYVSQIVVLTVGFTALSFTLGRRVVDRSVTYLHNRMDRNSGIKTTFVILLGISFGTITLKIGIHALFGFFIAGVVLGEATHITEKDRFVINRLVYSIFVPIYFASIGLYLDFFTNFDPLLTFLLLVVGVTGRFVGAWFGAKWGGQDKADLLTIAISHTPGGQMHIVVAMLAYSLKLISTQVLVAIIASAVLSTIIFGPWLAYAINRLRKQFLSVVLKPEYIMVDLAETNRESAIQSLVRLAASFVKQDMDTISKEVSIREEQMSTALGKGLAIPHARLEHIDRSYIFGLLAPRGIEWDSPDGQSVRIALLILTPKAEPRAQIQILQSLAITMKNSTINDDIADDPHPEDVYDLVRNGLVNCAQCQLHAV